MQLHEAVDVLRTQPFDCVLYLGALNGPLNDDFGLSSSSDPIASTSAEILQITQSCIEHRRPLWLVTRGAQAVLDDERDVNLAQSHVWGWAKTVALEHPEAWGGIVDLEPSTSQVASARVLVIAMVLATADDEDQIAFRNGERYVPRLHRAAAPPAASAPLATDKLYLITGGLGGIGLRLARWMAQRGARHLLLVSRTGLPDRSVWGEVDGDTTVARQISAIREIENLGAEVSLRKLDICDRDLVRSLFATLPRELGGILHLAAAGEFSSLSNMTEAAVREVMSPKTIGTWNLHDASKNLPIDFFVLFSSWAAVLGAENLAHYNAANQFLDAFAYYRRSQNLCATVVNWGTWDILRHASDAMRMGFERSGMKPLASDAAFTAMFRTVAAGTTQAIVANVDWQNLKPLYESRRPRPFLEAASNLPADLSSPNLLAHPVAQETQQPEKPPQSISPAIRNVLAAIPLQQRIPKLIAWVIETLSSVLRISSPELTASSQTGELGMDSLMALDVRRRIQSEFEIVIPISLLVEGVTVAELASRIASALPDPVSGHIQETGTIATVEDALPVESFPLSHIQRAGWVNLKLIPDAGIFQVGFAAEASPPLQWEAFKRAVWRLMELHAALRTVFFETAEGEPQQRVLPSWKPETTLIHVPGLTDDEIAEVVTREHRKAFNVEESVLRITVFRRAQTDIAVISVHHLAVDASSMGFCIEDLA
ncbi:MAG: KR domain-containing protein, partial [Acidobacteriaceae bacterium]